MLLEAARQLDIDLSRSWMVGDKADDVLAGKAAGCKTVLLRTGESEGQTCDPDVVAGDLKQAADAILADSLPAGQTYPVMQDPSADLLKRIERIMVEIRNELRQSNRMARHSDFSVLKMAGVLVEVFALAVLFWAAVGAVDIASLSSFGAIHLRLVTAVALQLLALTFFLLDRKRCVSPFRHPMSPGALLRHS